jgi:hypothetical protein
MQHGDLKPKKSRPRRRFWPKVSRWGAATRVFGVGGGPCSAPPTSYWNWPPRKAWKRPSLEVMVGRPFGKPSRTWSAGGVSVRRGGGGVVSRRSCAVCASTRARSDSFLAARVLAVACPHVAAHARQLRLQGPNLALNRLHSSSIIAPRPAGRREPVQAQVRHHRWRSCACFGELRHSPIIPPPFARFGGSMADQNGRPRIRRRMARAASSLNHGTRLVGRR